ncbi:hypothetical protein CWB96_22130 [Pseudoalteromonas citrea]|uniref:Uncharacterized protein n=1 Tax=Pseudoalteromonas citrea TaxID=43655 RepID=A0A5S3XFK6_9GAMM|nr:hypothetical protein [Pseudoalteromonas citrea]TMP44018.1 hypothetical protein CWB97_07520 [Pseudoalteromonas citrea]TMP51823.1 hypothetical protein CWB96_22130 [Pseudoalteromonas citrea]
MNIAYSLFAVLLSTESVVGTLQLQEPAGEYYYSRDGGVVINDYQLKLKDKVSKGQILLTYVTQPDQIQRTIIARDNGYIEYVNGKLSRGYEITSDEMLYKVKSNRIFGWYYLKSSNLQPLDINIKLWACNQQGVKWAFDVDAVKPGKILVSALVPQNFNNVKVVDQQGLVMYFNELDCTNGGSFTKAPQNTLD